MGKMGKISVPIILDSLRAHKSPKLSYNNRNDCHRSVHGYQIKKWKKEGKKLCTRREEKKGAIYRIAQGRKERLAAKIANTGQGR